jgi:purine-cytosine permease-like protein
MKFVAFLSAMAAAGWSVVATVTAAAAAEVRADVTYSVVSAHRARARDDLQSAALSDS